MDPSLLNPYQAPAAELPAAAEIAGPGEGATRGARLLAYLIDLILSIGVMLPIELWAGVFKGFPSAMKPMEFPSSLIWTLAWVVLWVVLNGTFLIQSSQTIGKKLMGLQIVMLRGGMRAPFDRLVFWRFLPMMLISQITTIGPLLGLLDSLFIFRQDRRCLHDHIAGTRVVALEKK